MPSTPITARRGLRYLAGVLALGLLAATIAGPAVSAAGAQGDADKTTRSINVAGIGRVKLDPDVADVQLGVTQQAEDARTASEKAAIAMAAVIKALLAAEIAETDIQTTSLNLNPSYDWDDNPPNIVGWEASNLVNVTLRDIGSIGDVVDTAIAAGATNVSGISFRVEDPTEAEAAARSEAVADAEAKAQQLALAAGVNIVAVIHITESGGQPPQPIYFDRAQEAAFDTDGGAPTPVLPGEVELSVSVSIEYEIEG